MDLNTDCNSTIEKGWQCPVCKAVYNPNVSQCFNCNSPILIGKKLNTLSGWEKSNCIEDWSVND